MVKVLYVAERAFMGKTYRALDRHLDVPTAYVAVRPDARGCCAAVREVRPDAGSDVDAAVRVVDPDVVVYNHRFREDEMTFHEEYPLVHVRHGASVGRGEIANTRSFLPGRVARALAPGDRWARRYPDEVPVTVVGVPEADPLVAADPPRERRVLYAPTNHNHGGGSYLRTAEHVLDTLAGTSFELLFRPHPMDRIEEPGRSLTEQCRERIGDLPNATFDETDDPIESMLRSDLLVSDYSGIVTEWLHTGRPLVQLTDLADEEASVPHVGHATDRLDCAAIERLYEEGYDEPTARCEERFRAALGVPMDGRAGERAAREVRRCAA